MALRDRLAVGGGLTLAAFGLGAFLAAGRMGAVEPASPPAGPDVPAVGRVVVEDPLPAVAPEGISGLADPVARVLIRSGFAERADVSVLPTPVRRVLEANRAVLTVEEGR